MIVLYIILGLILIGLLIFLRSAKGRGIIGEYKVSSILKKYVKNGKGRLINDVIIPDLKSDKTSQIDHILFTSGGIFVIETKNYSGRIYGDANQREWTQVLNYGRVKNKLYNPLMQNRTHICRVSDLLNRNSDIYSLVVFVQGNVEHVNAPIFTRRTLKKYLNLVALKNVLTPTEVEDCYNAINKYKLAPIQSTHEHVKEIKKMQKNINNNICPRCGAKLVIRKGTNGNFYGCSNYPKCTFTKKIDN